MEEGSATVRLVIQRGTREIGGSCVELQAQGKSLLLDIGMPLVNADGSRFRDKQLGERSVDELVAERLLPNVPGLYGDGPCDVLAIIVSHSHLDHYGLGHFARPDVPVYVTQGTKAILGVNSIFLSSAKPLKNVACLPDKWKDLELGPFTVIAWPVDHSAADAVAFEVTAGGKKVFYSGDLRGHGWKHRLFEHMLSRPPENVDVMLMEGSSIGRGPDEYAFHGEEAVKSALVELLTASKGRATFVFCSSQNIDRIVTLRRAARKTRRELVIGLYTAYVLHRLKGLSSKLPQYNSEGVRVTFWPHHIEALKAADPDFYWDVVRSGHGIKDEEFINRSGELLAAAKVNRRWLGLIGDVLKRGPVEMVWSMWTGYLREDDRIPSLCAEHDLTLHKMHSSGHATVGDLKRLAQAIQPKCLVPIHTFHPDDYDQFGVDVRRLDDGDVLEI